jgi:hypothetical protein
VLGSRSAHFALSSDHFAFIPFHFARVQVEASLTAAVTPEFDGAGGIGCICACAANNPDASNPMRSQNKYRIVDGALLVFLMDEVAALSETVLV